MTVIPQFDVAAELGKVGSYHENGSAKLLKAKTYIGPSVVVPRVKRWFSYWGLRDEYRPQRERGLFFKEEIPRGTKIGTYEGFVVDWKHLYAMDETSDYVIWCGQRNDKLVGVLGDNFLKMANHEPVSRATMVRIGLDFYAAADLTPDTEATWSYDGSDDEFENLGASARLAEMMRKKSSAANPAVQPS